MNLSNKIFDFITNVNYWKEYREHSKIKEVLLEFFSKEDQKLQQAFTNNFDYPNSMTQSPVRLEYYSGDIYYTLNFKSKELFQNQETKEKALSNSLAILDKHLPLGITSLIEPQAPVHIPDTFTLLCYIKIQNDDVTLSKTIWNTIGTILKPLSIVILFSAAIKYLWF
tara:strand:+ start:754 stop:1257 length:504 start_codon:yes stop_codon:yes gene_type:complete